MRIYSQKEKAIIRTHYPTEGVQATVKALEDAGYIRSGKSVSRMANAIGLSVDKDVMKKNIAISKGAKAPKGKPDYLSPLEKSFIYQPVPGA